MTTGTGTSKDTTRFVGEELVVQRLKKYLSAPFGVRSCATIRFEAQISDITCCMIGLARETYALYGLTVK